MEAFDFICQNRDGVYLRGECTASHKDDLSKKLSRARLFLVWWTLRSKEENDPPAPSVIDEMWMRPINAREVMQLMSSGKSPEERHELAKPLERPRFRYTGRYENIVRYGVGAVVWMFFTGLTYVLTKPPTSGRYEAIPPGFISALTPLRPGMRRGDVEKILRRLPEKTNSSQETHYAGPPGLRAVVVYNNAGGLWSEKNVIVIPPGIRTDTQNR